MLELNCPHDPIQPHHAVGSTFYDPDKIYDLLVIGAGMMGTSAAHSAEKAGIRGSNIAVLDRSFDLSLTDGASRRSAGKFVSLYNKPPEELVKDLTNDYIVLGESQRTASRHAHAIVVRILQFLRKGCHIFEVRENEFPKPDRTLVNGLLVVDRFLSQDQLQSKIRERTEYGLSADYDFFDEQDVAQELGSKPGEFKSGYLDIIGGCFHPGRYMASLHDLLFKKGIQFFLKTNVTHIRYENGLFVIECDDGRKYRTKKVFSASVHDPAISKKIYEHTLPFVAHAVAIDVSSRPDILPRTGAFYDTKKLALYGQRRDDVLWLGHNDSIVGSRRVALKNANDHLHQAEDTFNLTSESNTVSWYGTYYQSPNELPMVVQERPGFIAAGGVGGYGNTLGQVIGELVGAHLAGEVLSILKPRVKSGMDFFFNLPHIERFVDEQQQLEGAKNLLQECYEQDEENRRDRIRLDRTAAKTAGHETTRSKTTSTQAPPTSVSRPRTRTPIRRRDPPRHGYGSH